ncbi:heme-binding protein 2 isoform X2 [Dasypus novemcinctus]|uniref:heme-binding protein 2 isoform X2 n=1 Tax=Dasypus novemcinctus TaxID=9361 RepID=UPI0039C9BB7C
MAEVAEPEPGVAPETPAWQAPEHAGAQPRSYEIRRYGPAKWVSTSLEALDWDSAVQAGFSKLSGYLAGKNDREMKIQQTAPVTSFVEPGAGPFSQSTVTVSLYLPAAQQAEPPQPAEPGVFIEDRAEMTVFASYRLPAVPARTSFLSSSEPRPMTFLTSNGTNPSLPVLLLPVASRTNFGLFTRSTVPLPHCWDR